MARRTRTISQLRRAAALNLDGGIHEIPVPAGVPGRLWLCGKHAVGPDPEAALDRIGGDVVVCLNDATELEGRYPEYVEWLRTSSAERAVWHPVPDLHAPEPGSFEPVLADLVARLRSGSSLLVHCGAGVGRAGTVAVAILVALGVGSDAALERVRRNRPAAGPETSDQLAYVERLESPPGSV